MKIRAAVLVWALAAVAGAQTTIRPGGGGGSSTITAGTTATSGCTNGGFLYSLSSLIQCGSLMVTDGTNVITASIAGSSAANGSITINGTTSATKTTSYINLQDTGGNVGIGVAAPDSPLHVVKSGAGVVQLARFQNTTISGYSSIVLGSNGSANYWEAYGFDGGGTGGVGNPASYGFNIFTGGRANTRINVSGVGATTIGNSALGTSVVPLTLTPGTGSTANIQNWTNSAGTVLANVYSNGVFNTPAFGATSGTPTGGYAQGGTMVLWASTAGTVAAGYTLGVGGNNTWVGDHAGNNAGASVDFSVAVGRYAMPVATGTTRSTAVGASACYDVTTGDNNTCIGIGAGIGITTGSGNTIVGQAHPLAAGLSNNVILADGGTDVAAGQQRYRAFSPVTLTEAGGAETVLTLTSATTNTFTVDVDYMVTAKDATPDYATRKGSVGLVCVNNATVVTCTSSATSEANDGRNGGGSILINTNAKTLTYAIAVDVATANVAKLTFNIDSDMTVTAASITMTVTINGTVTPS